MDEEQTRLLREMASGKEFEIEVSFPETDTTAMELFPLGPYVNKDELRRHIQAMIGGVVRWHRNDAGRGGWIEDGMVIVGGSKEKIIHYFPHPDYIHDAPCDCGTYSRIAKG